MDSSSLSGNGMGDTIKNPHNPILSLAVMGGALATVQVYSAVAPSLQSLRSRPQGDTTGRQQLLDANIIVGLTVMVAGSFAAWGVNSWVPLLALLMVYGFLATWYWMVLNSPNGHIVEIHYVG